MSFHSLAYLCFFPIVLALYWSLPRRGQNALVVLASYVFYGWEHPWFLLPLWGSTLVDYGCARAMEKNPASSAPFLVISVVVSVALLGTFKYAGFAISNLNEILTRVGSQPLAVIWQLALPAGLSFYTFQSIGYVVDVYVGRVKAERNLLDYALYVSFFPQLVAGPIERAGHMLPQYHRDRRFDAADWRAGLGLMLWGFFKKVVIADNAAFIANRVFGLNHPSFPVLWAGVSRLPSRSTPTFRLHRYRPRECAVVRHRTDAQFQSSLHRHFAGRLLATLAHLAFHLAARFHLHSARRFTRERCPRFI